MTEWVRVYSEPREVRRFRREWWTPRMVWLSERSKARYAARPDSTDTDKMRIALMRGEIGRIDGFRFIQSPLAS